MTGLRKALIWTGALSAALALFMVGAFALLIVFDEAAYWRTLLRHGKYQQLDVVFSEIEGEAINPFKPMAWIFSREIRQRFSRFDEVKEGLSISAVDKRTPPGTTCPETGAEKDRLTLSPVLETAPGVLAPSSGAGLCEIEYVVTNGGFGVNVMLGVGPIRLAGKKGPDVKFGSYAFLKPGESQTLTVRLNRSDALPRTYRILAVAGRRQRVGPTDWIGMARTETEVKDLIRRAARLGLVMGTARHEVKK